MPKYEKIPYNKDIANYVKKAVKDGVSIKDIVATVNVRYQNAPRTHATFYKLYGDDISDARAEIIGKVGNVVVQQALDGHFPSQELFLRSKGGWSPTNTVLEGDYAGDQDQDSSAVDDLMALLGKRSDKENESSEDNSGSSEESA